MRVKQIIFIVILFFVVTQINGQNNELCGEVEYKQATNFSRYFERFFVTKFNKEISYSSEIKIKKSTEKVKELVDEVKEQVDDIKKRMPEAEKEINLLKEKYNNLKI